MHAAFRFQCAGSVALQHVGSSSLTKDRTHIPCVGRQLPNHWTIRAVLEVFFSLLVFLAEHSPLIVVASPVVEHRLWAQAQ